ncbi:MAG: zinc-ribbon domain-containing protein, partial [Chloroflexi bacterium]|nr:zinc-ribbon domain-containing protein [Chloroflexota bacterium]
MESKPIVTHCPKCGTETKGAKFCPECGEKLA